MPLGIPLPGQPFEAFNTGVNTGRGLFESMMRPKLKREELAQLQQQYEQTLAQRQAEAQQLQAHRNATLAETSNYHNQLMEYKNLAENRKVNEFEHKKALQPHELEHLKAKIEHEKAKAEKAKREPSSNYKPSELERIVQTIANGDPDKARELLAEGGASKYGLTLPGAKDLPVGSEPFKSLPKNLQAQENADQIKMQSKVNDAHKGMHDLDEMEKIIDKNPDMAREWAYLIGNPEDKSFVANLSRRYVDKKKLAAIESFVKLSNDFVLAAGSGLGNNFTDAKLKAMQLSKMHAGNQDLTNKAIIASWKAALKPMINYGRELKKARGKYTLPYFQDSYTDEALGIRGIQDLTDEELEAL
jgi:hypothetical protein